MKWFFLLYFINICVDAPDPIAVKKVQQHYSEQETIVEMVVEQILGLEQAIPDFDQNDTDDPAAAKSGKLPIVFVFHHQMEKFQNFTTDFDRPSFAFATNLYSFLRIENLIKPPGTYS